MSGQTVGDVRLRVEPETAARETDAILLGGLWPGVEEALEGAQLTALVGGDGDPVGASEHAQRVEDLPADNVVTAQIALEQGSVEALAPVLRGLGALLAGPRHASLRRAFAEWTRQVVEGSGLASAQPGLSGVLRRLEEAGELEEMGTLLAERIDEFAEKRAEERAAEQHARGLEQGRERGLEQERALLVRQAARKFGAGTAERLAALLGGIDDPERLAEIGEAVIDCADGAELLVRAAAAGGSG